MTEAEFQRGVVQLAEVYRWLVYHTFDSRRSQAGYPDLTLVRGPRLIYAELKTDTGRLRPEQTVWLERLAGVDGIEVYVWRPAGWDTIDALLRSDVPQPHPGQVALPA